MRDSNDEIPDIVKEVYNDHLIATKVFHRKPFKRRKNFKGFKEDPKYIQYHKLAIWFDRHPNINRKLFFEAYLYYHPKMFAIPIKYYIQPRALTFYRRYRKMLESMNLDDSNMLNIAVDSFKFIRKFCHEKDINFDEYMSYKEDTNVTYSWLKHVKEGNVIIYVLFAKNGFIDVLKNLYKDVDVWDFYIGRETPYFYQKRWLSSSKFQTLARKAIKIVTKQ